jgi:magnesium-transporting ATPase (P-type)
MTNKDNSYQNDVNEILISLETTKDGLSSEEAAKRLSKHGHNSLKEPEIES